MPVL
jgi:hypothetical protein